MTSKKLIIVGLKKLLKRNFSKQCYTNLGLFSLEDIEPIDLTGICLEPLSALNRTRGLSVMVDVPLSSIFCMGPIYPSSFSNPYYLTARQFIENSSVNYEESALAIYYTDFIPKNAAELMDSSSRKLQSFPPKYACEPWAGISGISIKKAKDRRAIRHGKLASPPLSADDGDYSVGPFSTEKGKIEFNRLINIIQSIRHKGYKPQTDRNNIKGNIYKFGNAWKIGITNGKHRIPVLNALGFKSVPVIIRNPDKIILDVDVKSWPGVSSGDFTEIEAIKMLQRIFEDRNPLWLNSLIEDSEIYSELVHRYNSVLFSDIN